MFGKFADVIAHGHIAHAIGLSVLAAGYAHEIRPDMNSALSINTA